MSSRTRPRPDRADGPRLPDEDWPLVVAAADAICRQASSAVANAESDAAELVHLRGKLVSHHDGDTHALPYFRRAVRLDRTQAAYRLDLIDALHRSGRHRSAIRACRPLLRTPSRADALSALGRARLAQGRLDAALRAFEAAQRLRPDDARLDVFIGDIHSRRGDEWRALLAWWRAFARDPHCAPMLRKIGRLYAQRGDWAAALAVIRCGLRLEPGSSRLHTDAGCAWRALGDNAAALRALRTALTANPRDLAAARQFVCTIARSRDHSALAAAWYTLGVALDVRDRFDEARVAYAQAHSIVPDHVDSLVNRGNLHLRQGEPDRAIPWYRKALARAPLHQGARMNLGWCQQLRGDYASGWRAFAWQDAHGAYIRRHFASPEWKGDALPGGTLLLWMDQALGDAVHFLRYVRLARARAARVIVECHAPLAPLVARMPDVDAIIGPRALLPPLDAHAPLSRLPEIFGTTVSTIPGATPYLTVDPDLLGTWRLRLGARRPAIGLNWSGNEGSRTGVLRFMPLEALAPLARVHGCRFISLQHGRAAASLMSPPKGLDIEMIAEESRSLAETAALIANLDLVITVDTMIAHLAGALARPVWTMIACAPDWRWGLALDATAWYPSMRLFRQRHPGVWRDVVEDVRRALEDFVGARGVRTGTECCR